MEKACGQIRDGEAHADALTKQEREQGGGCRGLVAVNAVPLPDGAVNAVPLPDGAVDAVPLPDGAVDAVPLPDGAASAVPTRRWAGATVGSCRARCGRAEV